MISLFFGCKLNDNFFFSKEHPKESNPLYTFQPIGKQMQVKCDFSPLTYNWIIITAIILTDIYNIKI